MVQMLLCNYAIDVVEPFAIWGTVSVVAAFLIASLVLLIVKRAGALSVLKKLFMGLVLYAVVLGIVLLVMEISKKYSVAYLEDNWVSLDIVNQVFIPILATSVLTLFSAIIYIIASKKEFKNLKVLKHVLTAICVIAFVATLVLITVYYSNNIVGDGYYTEDEKLNSTALCLLAATMIVVSIAVAIFADKKGTLKFDTKCITFAGITIAMSFALSYIKLFEMPNGGAVTLVSMFPVMLFAYMYGMKKGLLVGFIYGLLQAVQDPFIIHPAQFLLDYPIAFAMLGFAGLLSHAKGLNKVPQLKFAISAILGGGLRYFAHVLSGVFAFGAYAGDANFWTYSLAYNVYVFVDVALVLVIGVLLLSSNILNKEINRYVSIEEK